MLDSFHVVTGRMCWLPREVSSAEVLLTSSLMRLEDWLSWPSWFNRSTCSSNSLSRVISVVCLYNIDDAVLWCGCSFITSSESFPEFCFLAFDFGDHQREWSETRFLLHSFLKEIEQFFHLHFCRFEHIDGKLTFLVALLCCSWLLMMLLKKFVTEGENRLWDPERRRFLM